TVAYAESGVCRRKLLLNYFGEKFEVENCGGCDNCLHPKEKVEAKEKAVLLLKTIKALDEQFATDYVQNILCGVPTPNNTMYRHNLLSEFGQGKETSPELWGTIIRQMLLEGYLSKDIEDYGVLKITAKGKDYLKKPKSFKIIVNHSLDNANEDDEDDEVSVGLATDEALFEMLKDLRQKEAK